MERSRNDNYLLCICSQNNNGLRGSPNATLKSALQVMRFSERPLDNLNFWSPRSQEAYLFSTLWEVDCF